MGRSNSLKNLVQNRSPEEFRAASVKGGIRSVEVRRKKKAMRELARDILDTHLSNEDDIRAELEKRGIQLTESAAILFAQLQRARTGDTEAARFLRDTSGQKPVDNVAIGNLDDKPFETLDLTKLSDDQLRALASTAKEEKEED